MKRFDISYYDLENSYEKVRKNQGSAGVDGLTFKDFDLRRDNLLYKLWNRMSSGSYFPQPVKAVSIAKATGGVRILGIPTITDRTAQQLVVTYLTARFESIFLSESYGYRRGVSAHDALESCRTNCFSKAWVLDLDIKGFFDNIPHDKLMKAVSCHVSERWILLYIGRWLTSALEYSDGRQEVRDKGVPQGGVISPLLANLYLHYVLDIWLQTTEFKGIPFERYADDVILHCNSHLEAERLLSLLTSRFESCGLELHPDKTKIVYCKNGYRKDPFPTVQFTFLGYDFHPRLCKNSKTGKPFLGFSNGISRTAKKKICQALRGMRIGRLSELSIKDLAWKLNIKTRGWIKYYGRFRRSEMQGVFRILNAHLVTWITKKYKQYRQCRGKAWELLRGWYNSTPDLFHHWKYGFAFA